MNVPAVNQKSQTFARTEHLENILQETVVYWGSIYNGDIIDPKQIMNVWRSIEIGGYPCGSSAVLHINNIFST